MSEIINQMVKDGTISPYVPSVPPSQATEAPEPNGKETEARRDFLLATLLILCLVSLGVIVGAEHITGMQPANSDTVIRILEQTILIILTGHFALARSNQK
jgi:hypothetical protein